MLAAARGYNIFVQCFPNDNFIIGIYYKTNTNTFFPYLSQNNSGNIFDSFILNYMLICSLLHFSYGLFIYYLAIT